MIRNALTGEPRPAPAPTPLSQQERDFTAEGAPAPGHTSGTEVPDTGVATPDRTGTP